MESENEADMLRNEHELPIKTEVKEEPFWQELESLTVKPCIADPLSLNGNIASEIKDFSSWIDRGGEDALKRELSRVCTGATYTNDIDDTIVSTNSALEEDDSIITGVISADSSDVDEKNCNELSQMQKNTCAPDSERPHVCKICGKSFALSSRLKRHSLIHKGIKPFKCKICDKSFNQMSNLKMHNFVHEGQKPFKCEFCEKTFIRMSQITNHILNHQGKKPYECKKCDRSFSQLSGLKRHSLTHEDKKPYECEVCEKSYTQAYQLKIHNLKHTG